MIKGFEFFHGAVLARLLHSTEDEVVAKRFDDADNASYVLNERIGIYVKYSTKRLPPWRFSFQKRHQDQISQIRSAVGTCFVLLVCNDDGIVALSFDELKRILNDVHDQVEWISVSRNRRQMYAVAGSDGKLGFKVGINDFPAKMMLPANNTSTTRPS